jgi:hypothetical protein
MLLNQKFSAYFQTSAIRGARLLLKIKSSLVFKKTFLNSTFVETYNFIKPIFVHSKNENVANTKSLKMIEKLGCSKTAK